MFNKNLHIKYLIVLYFFPSRESVNSFDELQIRLKYRKNGKQIHQSGSYFYY